MKLKFLQNNLLFTPYSPKNEDYYYEFDYPKYQITPTTKYTVLPVQTRSILELQEPKTALDYEVWATLWGSEPTVPLSAVEALLNPEQNRYKGIVYYAIAPRGDTFSGENGYRDHRATGFTCNLKGEQWTDFKRRLELTPKGRRVVDINVYWWSDIWPYTPNKWNYYKNTTDGTTYENTRFLTPWTERIASDAATSFDGFLALAHKEGISFDYLTSDFEGPNLLSMTIDGYNAFIPANPTYPQKWGYGAGISADARTISAWLADSRFSNYIFPKTQKSFADLFFENYIAIANADPNIVNKPELYNHIIWDQSNLSGYRGSIANFVNQYQRSPTSTEFGIQIKNDGTSTGIVYRRNPNGGGPGNIFSVDNDTDSSGNWVTDISGVSPVKLMGQTLDNVVQFLIGNFIAVALKNNGYVIPWGAAFTPEINGTNATGEAYFPEYFTDFGDSILPGKPVQLLGVTLQAKYVALSQDRLCAIKNDDTVVCWGGASTSWDPTNPDIRDTPTGLTASKILGGSSHFIALRGNGGVTCWGDNTFGQCDVPGGIVAKDVSAGFDHSCAVLSDNSVSCWGDNTFGQCDVPAGLTAKQVVCGKYFTRAVKNNGSAVVWGQCDDVTGYPLGSNSQGQGIVASPATGQYVQLLGVSLNNIDSFSSNYWQNAENSPNIANTKVIYRPQSALEILQPFLGVTFSGITGARYVGEYWTPYGCEGSITCGCGPLGSRDLRKSAFPELTGYTYSMYSMFHVLAPAWMTTVSELQMNNYLKQIFYDNYKKSEYPSYNKVEFLTYEFPPTSSEEVPFYQESNLQKRARPPMPWANGGRPYYLSNGSNYMFTTYTYDFNTGDGITYLGSYQQAWDLRSGYVQNPQTDIEKYNFNGYLDVNADAACSVWNNRLIRYPITNKFPEGQNRVNFYKFADEYLWKVFVSFIKDLRQDHRSDPTLWERFTPWIWYPGIWSSLIGWEGDGEPKQRQTRLLFGYWYELNFHLLLHGVKLFQCFQYGGEHVQRTLDIWRVLTNNSRVRPCSNSTANVNLPVERLLLQDAFEKYIISGGKNIRNGDYHWRITVPPVVFGANDTVTLTRVGGNTDFPQTVTLDRNSSYPENRFGFWVKSSNAVVPQYTVS